MKVVQYIQDVSQDSKTGRLKHFWGWPRARAIKRSLYFQTAVTNCSRSVLYVRIIIMAAKT